VLTGGGDCPGLNAAIRSLVRKATVVHGDTVIGFLDAWDGVLAGNWIELSFEQTRGTIGIGGTILGTRRGSPLDHEDGPRRVTERMRELDLDAMVVIGGNGSLTVASILHERIGLPVIGLPKTIDNDVVGTDVTFGFATAVQTATDAIDRLRTTAESHDRCIVVEVMGREAGWIALYAGIAGGATAILVPERRFDIDEVIRLVGARHSRHNHSSLVVVAEGALPIEGSMPVPDYVADAFGHLRLGGISQTVATEIERRSGLETRVTQLGLIQRGGSPVAADRILGTRLGSAAVDAVHDGAFGTMAGLRNNEIRRVPLAEVAGRTRLLDMALYDEIAEVFFG
jgi:6-phosphofructokinase 1